MLCVGARFDDRITGRTDAFSPGSKKIHIDIDPSSINKNIRVDIPIIGDAANVLGDLLQVFKAEAKKPDIRPWWQEIAKWRARNSLSYKKNSDVILPQFAIQRLFEATAAATPTSPPRSASTRCGRRSSSASRSRTAG
jgi:acetolactate synthase-1/2/3 large subunit